MGIRKEIKLVIKEYATCTVGANEAINAISNIVSRPKPEKLFPKPKQLNLEDVLIPELTEEMFKKI